MLDVGRFCTIGVLREGAALLQLDGLGILLCLRAVKERCQ
jgi:hypothetical protein